MFLAANHLTGAIPVGLGNLSNLRYLYLFSNQLTGAIPAELDNLGNLVTDGLDQRWNALYTSNWTLDAFLNSVQRASGDWSATQTIAPANVKVSGVTETTASLSWDAIEYTGDTGRYRVWYGTSQGGPYASDGGATANKDTTSLTVTGLSAGNTYYFVVRTETDSHANNQSNVVSGDSVEVSATNCIYTITQPNGEENWVAGHTYSINWSSSGANCAATARIELYEGGVLKSTFATGTGDTSYS